MAEGESNRPWTLIAVCMTTFMLLVDITIVNVALPSIQPSLSAGLTGFQWVVDAYAITLAALILTAGSEHRVQNQLTAAGYPGRDLAAAVSSSGLRAAAARPALAPIANAAFVSAFRLILLIGALTVAAGALAP